MSVEEGRKLYRKLAGSLSGDTAADEFGALDDTAVNRGRLSYLAERGGDRGRAARAQLSEWDTARGDDGPPAA